MHWLLVIPHAVVVGVLGNVAGAVAFIAWFAIVLTGRMPEGLASFECLVIRYQARVSSYALWLREPYPAFEFELTPVDPGDDPVRVDLRPQLEERNRLTVALRMFLLIPITLFLAVVGFAAFFVSVAGFFAVLFGGRWPGGMHRFLTGTIRLGARVGAYGYLLVDEYPPFSVALSGLCGTLSPFPGTHPSAFPGTTWRHAQQEAPAPKTTWPPAARATSRRAVAPLTSVLDPLSRYPLASGGWDGLDGRRGARRLSVSPSWSLRRGGDYPCGHG